MNDLTPESCTTKIKQWWIDFYKSPCFGIKCISAVIILGLAAFGLFKIITSAFYYFSEPLSYFDPERLGQLGDFLGGTLNPIFGFATVCLLLWSIFIQRKELALAANELNATSNALKDQLKHNQEHSARHQLTEILNKEYDRYDSLFSERFKHINGQGKLAYRKLMGFETFKEIVANDVSGDFSDDLNYEFQNFNPLSNPTEDFQKDLGAAFLVKIKIDNSIQSLKKVTIEMLCVCDVESVETYWFMKFYDAMQECEDAGIIKREEREEIINNLQPFRKMLSNKDTSV